MATLHFPGPLFPNTGQIFPLSYTRFGNQRLGQVQVKDMRAKKPLHPKFLTVAIAAIAGLTVSWLGGLTVGLLIAAIILCSALSYWHPRTGLWLFLIYIPLSGTVVYSIGQGNPGYHLFKDAFYIPALIALLRSPGLWSQFKSLIKPLLIPLLALLIICLTTFILVNGYQTLQDYTTEHPLLIGLLGFKVLMGYIPLIFCGYYLIRDRQDLLFLQRLHIVLIVLCCTLALLQYRFLVTGLCPGSFELGTYALDKATLEAKCLVGGALLYNPEWQLIRLPGTFVSPWQWSWFLISSAFFSYATYASDPTHRWRLCSFVSMAYIFIVAMVSGQRVAIVLVPVVFLVLVLLTDGRKRWIPIKLGISAFLYFVLAGKLIDLQQPLESFLNRWQASPPYQFILGQFTWTLNQHQGWLGNGLGRATNSARILGETQLIETYYAKLLYEIGPLGVVAFGIFISMVAFLTFKAYRSLQNSELRRLGLCLWVFIISLGYNTFYYPLDVDPVAVYYWLLAGVLLKLPVIDSKKPLPDNLFAQNKRNCKR